MASKCESSNIVFNARAFWKSQIKLLFSSFFIRTNSIILHRFIPSTKWLILTLPEFSPQILVEFSLGKYKEFTSSDATILSRIGYQIRQRNSYSFIVPFIWDHKAIKQLRGNVYYTREMMNRCRRDSKQKWQVQKWYCE